MDYISRPKDYVWAAELSGRTARFRRSLLLSASISVLVNVFDFLPKSVPSVGLDIISASDQLVFAIGLILLTCYLGVGFYLFARRDSFVVSHKTLESRYDKTITLLTNLPTATPASAEEANRVSEQLKTFAEAIDVAGKNVAELAPKLRWVDYLFPLIYATLCITLSLVFLILV